MKKNKVLIMLFVLFFLTGCSCEYNLTIDNSLYKEKVSFSNLNSDEIIELNSTKMIPVDKDSYDVELDSNIIENIEKYNYFLTDNNYFYSYDFTNNNYSNSTAVSRCFETFVVEEYDGEIIISTSDGATCFDKYPNLDDLIINITIDREVISNNADKVNGNTYTWNIDRTNASSKSINIILTTENVIDNSDEANASKATAEEENILSFPEMYILAFVLFIVLLIGYAIVNIIKNKDDYIDERIDDNISDENDE